MGQQPSKQPSQGEVRLSEISIEETRAIGLRQALLQVDSAVDDAGPAAPGSLEEQLAAVCAYIEQLRSERIAVLAHLGGPCQCKPHVARAGFARSQQPWLPDELRCMCLVSHLSTPPMQVDVLHPADNP